MHSLHVKTINVLEALVQLDPLKRVAKAYDSVEVLRAWRLCWVVIAVLRGSDISHAKMLLYIFLKSTQNCSSENFAFGCENCFERFLQSVSSSMRRALFSVRALCLMRASISMLSFSSDTRPSSVCRVMQDLPYCCICERFFFQA